LAESRPVLPVDSSLKLLRELIEVPASHNAERLLEIILLDATDNSTIPFTAIAVTPPADAHTAEASKKKPVPKPASPKPEPEAAESKKEAVEGAPKPISASKPEPVAAVAVEATPSVSRALDDTVWPEVLNSIKKQYNTLYGVLRMAHPIFGEDEVELQLKFAFHQKRLNEVKNRKIIADFIREVTGRNISVKCTVNKDAVPAASSAVTASGIPQTPAELNSITDIFGGGEVLNS
jgi:hypothetical protein